jgi:hypothetical protein
MAGGSSFLFGAAPGIQPGNTNPFRVCRGIDEKLGNHLIGLSGIYAEAKNISSILYQG